MQPLLEVEGLKKTYPGFQLNGVSFSIYEDLAVSEKENMYQPPCAYRQSSRTPSHPDSP